MSSESLAIAGVAYNDTVFATVSGRSVVSFKDEVFEFPRAGEGSTLFTLNCGVSAFAANDTDAFIATLDNSDRVEIIKVPLP